MSKRFRLLYFTNASLLVLACAIPIATLFIRGESEGSLLLNYYAVAVVLSVTLCVSFLALNLYRIRRSNQHRIFFWTVSVFLLVWIVWGACQIVHAYTHGVTL
jgi:hypothetical protein